MLGTTLLRLTLYEEEESSRQCFLGNAYMELMRCAMEAMTAAANLAERAAPSSLLIFRLWTFFRPDTQAEFANAMIRLRDASFCLDDSMHLTVSTSTPP